MEIIFNEREKKRKTQRVQGTQLGENKSTVVTETKKASERASLVQPLWSTSDKEDEAKCYEKLSEVERAVNFLENCELYCKRGCRQRNKRVKNEKYGDEKSLKKTLAALCSDNRNF